MWPEDMTLILGGLHYLPTEHGFPAFKKPFIVQEVIDLGMKTSSLITDPFLTMNMELLHLNRK